VRLRLRPTKTTFYDMFTDSADNLVDGIRLMSALLAAAPGDRQVIASKIRDCEHAGDDATHRILRELNSTFVTPFDREDIYRLASRLDDVMDFVEAASDLVVLYDLDDLPSELTAITEVLQQAAVTTAEGLRRLQSLHNLEDYWIGINELENRADQLYRRFLAKLFSGTYDALMVLKLKEVVDQLEAAADAFENVADTVETIAVKES
jgi:predicted phosphate transport protein (TIGR00153 family)